MSEDFDQVFESQPGEHVHHTTEPAVSEDLISGECKDSNEQDDVSAIIQEYMEQETRIDELTKMNSSDPLNKGNMTRVSVEDAETNSVVEPGLDKVFNNCGEEDDETLATSTKRMEINEEDIGMVADTMELPEIKDSAPTECTDAVPVNHKISETPNVIRETTVRCDEVKFEDGESNVEVATELDGSASMAFDNSAFKDGKATTSKGKVRSMFGDSNSQAINFLGDTKVHGWDDDDPDTALVSTHGNKAVSVDESGGESLEGRTGSDNAEYGTELHGEALISPPKVEESCRLDENNSTALKLMIESTLCSPLTGKESECQAYKKCTKNSMEGMELENMVGGIILREIDSPKQGNIDLGSYQKDSQHRQCSLKEGCLTGDIDFLELNNLFSSNSAKINLKQTGNHLDFQNSANLDVSFGASKDTADLEEVQCPVDSLVTTAASNALMRLTTTEFSAGRKIENNTADSDADSPFFTGFELNLLSEDSQREEVDTKYQRKFEENLMSDTNGDMKRGEDNSVSITTVSAEQGFHLEKEMVADIDFLKQNQLVASDEPKNKIDEGSKQEGIVSDKSFVFKDSIEASKNIKESSGGSAKCTSYDENNANVAGNYKSSGSKDVTTFAMTRLEEATVETTDLNNFGLEENATMVSAALDGPVTECRGSAERGGALVETIGTIEFENSTNFAASGEPTAECWADDSKQLESRHSEETGIVVLSSLIKNDSSEDMLEAMDSSKCASVTNVGSLDVASDEPIYGNVGTNEKCEVSIINQENADCENYKDDFVLLEKCQETTEIEGSSSASSKHTTEFGGKDSNEGNPAPLNLDVEGAVSEDARQANFEFGQENSSETNLYQSNNIFANPTRKNDINVSVPATPKIVQKAHDMKENVQSAKMEQFGSVAMSRKSAKRRPLEDLQKN